MSHVGECVHPAVGLQPIEGAGIRVIAVERRTARAGPAAAGIVRRAGVAVVARQDVRREHAAHRRNARIVSALVVVVANHRGVNAPTRGIAAVRGAGVPVVAPDRGVDAARRRRARVGRAGVVVVAADRRIRRSPPSPCTCRSCRRCRHCTRSACRRSPWPGRRSRWCRGCFVAHDRRVHARRPVAARQLCTRRCRCSDRGVHAARRRVTCPWCTAVVVARDRRVRAARRRVARIRRARIAVVAGDRW